MEEQLAPPRMTVTGGTTWAGVLGGPLAWFASQQVSYVLVPWACHGGPLVAIHLVNLGALLLTAGAGALAWHEWRRADPELSDELGPPEGRQRFLGLVGLTLAALFALVIIAQTTGAFFFGPCER
jgi:hypothetical protein